MVYLYMHGSTFALTAAIHLDIDLAKETVAATNLEYSH